MIAAALILIYLAVGYGAMAGAHLTRPLGRSFLIGLAWPGTLCLIVGLKITAAAEL